MEEIQDKTPQVKKVGGTHILCRGHQLYQYDFNTDEIKLATYYERIDKDAKGNPVVRKSVFFIPGLLFVSALNVKNARARVAAGKFLIP